MSTQFNNEITLKKHVYKTHIMKIAHSGVGLLLWVQSLPSRASDNTPGEKICHTTGGPYLNRDNMTVVELF